jgi:hypothetical protein
VTNCLLCAVGDGGVGDDGARIKRLQGILKDPQQYARLTSQLHIIAIVAKKCVEATYILEGKL